MQHDYTLRLTAPFRCHFNLHNPRVASNRKEYINFLRDLKKSTYHPSRDLLSDFPLYLNVHFNIADLNDSDTKFVSMDENGTSFASPEIFTLRFDTNLFDDAHSIFQDASARASTLCKIENIDEYVFPNYDSLRIMVYDNTIAILSLELDFSFDSDSPYWSNIDAWTTYFCERLTQIMYPKYIWPLLLKMIQFSEERELSFILPPNKYYVFLDMEMDEDTYTDFTLDTKSTPECSLMWVSRTLILCRDDHKELSKWISRAIFPDDETVPCEDAKSHLGWGNNLVDLPHKNYDRRLIFPVWEGSHISQYYYAAMDVVSSNLSGFIGMTYSKQSNKNIREIGSNMEAVISSVMILQVAHLDVTGQLQGTSRSVFTRFEDQWGFNGLLENVQTKIDLCKSNVDQLYRVKNQRNQARSELVLTSLAGLGVVNLAVAISGLSYSLKKEGVEDDSGILPGIIDLGQSLSANTMGWIGIALAIVAVIIINKNSSAG